MCLGKTAEYIETGFHVPAFNQLVCLRPILDSKVSRWGPARWVTVEIWKPMFENK